MKFKNDMNETGFKIDSSEGPYNTGKEYENGNMGHRPGIKGGYFPVPPVDSAQDMRGEFLKALKDMGIKVEKHHHASQRQQCGRRDFPAACRHTKQATNDTATSRTIEAHQPDCRLQGSPTRADRGQQYSNQRLPCHRKSDYSQGEQEDQLQTDKLSL